MWNGHVVGLNRMKNWSSMIRIFYYLIVRPVLGVLRLIFFPLKLLWRLMSWIFGRISDSWYLRHADVDAMDGWEFEEYVAKLLRKNGFRHVEVTSGSGDQGVDILADKQGVSYAIQCKHYDGKIPNKAVQEAYAGARYYGCDVAVVLTNSYFYPSAFDLGDSIGVELWDRDMLNRLIRREL